MIYSFSGAANTGGQNSQQQRQLSSSKLAHNNYTNPNAVSNVSSNSLPKFHPQPVPATHPHLLKSGEVKCLIFQLVYMIYQYSMYIICILL